TQSAAAPPTARRDVESHRRARVGVDREVGHEDVPGAAEDLLRRLEDGFAGLLQGCRGSVKEGSLRASRALGRQAIALGMTVVDLARLHGRACRRVLATRAAVSDAAEWVAAA